MSDQFNTPDEFEPVPTPPAPDFGAAFGEMEQTLSNVPSNDFITLRSGSGQPVYVPLNDGSNGEPREDGLLLRDAITRSGLAVGVVNYYVDQTPVTLDTFIAAGTVVTMVGNVKGG